MDQMKTCKQCAKIGDGNYCNGCGQSYTTKRITINSIIHEIFHFFSHLDKGFLYTLKQLLINPGTMQREYVEGHRAKHQKPFSMFFLAATIATFFFYWVNLTLIKYFDAGDSVEASFFHQYYVILQIVMLPIYAGVTYLMFIRSGFNYAETFVLLLYKLSIILLISSALQLLKFIWTESNTRYLEFPMVIIYNAISNLNFYKEDSKIIVIVKTVLASIICFVIAYYVQDFLIHLLGKP